MLIQLDAQGDKLIHSDAKIFTAFQKKFTDKTSKKEITTYSIEHWKDAGLKEEFNQLRNAGYFKAGKDEVVSFSGPMGETIKVIGIGDKTKYKDEDLRKSIAKIFKTLKAEKHAAIFIDLSHFAFLGLDVAAGLIAESIQLTNYSFDKYLSKKSEANLKHVYIGHFDKKAQPKVQKAVDHVAPIVESMNFVRDLVNEAPNVLHSVEYAKIIEADAKKHLKKVKVKILNKAQIQKENMNLLLSVNAGSAHEPRLIHLTYEPTRMTSKTKHIALVGKGITFDTGGYSLKPGASMMGMKHDMAGSATVYGAFRSAVLLNAPVKITCIMALTDNAVSSHATFPDSIIKGRNGKTVEILNTDAEGRLILADALDYACDQKPDCIIDAATLTGACLVALGSQVCAVLGNNQKLVDDLLDHAKKSSEYMWQLPIIDEWRQDIKSKVADIKNIGTPMKAGTAIGAAFLEEFVKGDIAWAHLDIAGVADSQSHLPYCPSHGGSALIVRTLTHFILNGK